MSIHLPDHILFEDDFILVVSKPAGLMVEPDRNNHPNLQQLVKNYLQKSLPTGDLVYAQHLHRLDRPVSGVILFAKQKSVLRNLSEQFAQRTVRKFYQAITTNAPALLNGELQHWHRKEKKKAVLYPQQIEFSEFASLKYTINELKNRFLWNIELHTGKYHQIRAQLTSVGCPIVGDALYGSSEIYQDNCIALHACRLQFLHPRSGNVVDIEKEPDFPI